MPFEFPTVGKVLSPRSLPPFDGCLHIGYDPQQHMLVAIGSRLGSYEITDLIGRGGMGEVYRARDAKLNREVAVKFFGQPAI